MWKDSTSCTGKVKTGAIDGNHVNGVLEVVDFHTVIADSIYPGKDLWWLITAGPD